MVALGRWAEKQHNEKKNKIPSPPIRSHVIPQLPHRESVCECVCVEEVKAVSLSYECSQAQSCLHWNTARYIYKLKSQTESVLVCV